MAISDDKEIKRVVRERYAARATGAASRCAPDCCTPDAPDPATTPAPGIYAGIDLEQLPVEAIAASAGCGNPTALAEPKPGEVVLDLGSGGGIDCFLASRAVGPEGRVVGIDMTPEMIYLARNNARRMGVTNVEFHLGEMEDLPLASNSVDVVISNCVICLSPDKDAVLREAYRVLRPGGRLHVSDMMLAGELPQAIRDDPQRWAECVSGADQQETYLGRLAAAGFQDIAIEAEESYKKEGELENLRSVRVRAVKPGTALGTHREEVAGGMSEKETKKEKDTQQRPGILGRLFAKKEPSSCCGVRIEEVEEEATEARDSKEE